jgi:membrane dipeptidase
MLSDSNNETLQRALALLSRAPLIDGHNRIAWVIRRDPIARGKLDRFDLRSRRADGDTDIPRMRAGRVGGQVWSTFAYSRGKDPMIETLEQLDLLRQLFERHKEDVEFVSTARGFESAVSHGRIASLLAVEGGAALQGSIEMLRIWHYIGVRLVTLCHGKSLDWVDSATDVSRCDGLSSLGAEVVREMNRLGMLIDCSHASERALERVMEVSSAPIMLSHSNARALCAHVRNLTDDQLRRIRVAGGLVMVTFIPMLLSEQSRLWAESIGGYESQAAKSAPRSEIPQATITHVADHIEHIASIVGKTGVGIGSDFWGGGFYPDGLSDVSGFPYLIAELMIRGWTDDEIVGIARGNFIRTFAAVERVAQTQRQRFDSREVGSA